MQIVRGDVLKGDGIVFIPVNMVGVMGAGLAKQFKDLYPEAFRLYRITCETKMIQDETVIIEDHFRDFCMFPTKNHWRDKSDWSQIESRLKQDLQFIGEMEDYPFKVVSLPKIGCGLGGLDWNVVLLKLIPILLDFEDTYGAAAVVYV